jgi:hypothetical protein
LCGADEKSDYPPNFVVYDLKAKEVMHLWCAQCITNMTIGYNEGLIRTGQRGDLAKTREYNFGYEAGKRQGYEEGYRQACYEHDDIPF